MKYLKYFKTEANWTAYKDGNDYILPNVSYVEETKDVSYDRKKEFKLQAKYNATPDNLLAFTDATNLKSLKVNGTSIEFEPIKNEITSFDVLGENISINVETSEATFPESYLIKSPVSSWSFKAKDPNYVINENTYVCMLGMMDGMTLAQPMTLEEAMSYALTTNDGVTLELVDAFLNEMNMQIQSGLQIGFTLMDVDMNSQTFVFIDTEHQTNVTTGGLSNYSFDSEGLYDVEIELSDPVIKMKFAETPLISIEIGDGITSIGESAFENCIGLTSIIIPDSVTSIGNYVFDGCSSLISINIPNSVTSIGEGTFYNCYRLTSIVIPDSVTSIGDWAFYNCSGLTEIACHALVAPSIQSSTFQGVKNFGVLNYPEGSDYSSWMSTSSYYLGYYYWNQEQPVLTAKYNVTSTTESTKLCYRTTGFTDIIIDGEPMTSMSTGYTFTTIGEHTVEFYLNSTTIGTSAFTNCSGLTEITIPSGVTSIGNSAFRYCSGLTSITIGSGVTSIENYAFHYCSGLTSITSYAVTSPTIGSNTFEQVKLFSTLYVPVGSDYSSWMNTSRYYLGYYNWGKKYI